MPHPTSTLSSPPPPPPPPPHTPPPRAPDLLPFTCPETHRPYKEKETVISYGHDEMYGRNRRCRVYFTIPQHGDHKGNGVCVRFLVADFQSNQMKMVLKVYSTDGRDWM